MTDPVMHVLLIQDHDRDVDGWRAAFASIQGKETVSFRQAARITEAVGFLRENKIDVVLADIASDGDVQLEKLQSLRAKFSRIPVIAIIPEPNEKLALKIFQLGADDCIVRGESLDPILPHAVRQAVGRSRFRDRLEDESADGSHNLEIGRLTDLCGPAPLPVSERSFGVRPLRLEVPAEFEGIVDSYVKLLTMTLEIQDAKKQDSVNQLLDDIADHLGILNAGPRDLVELHKAAMLRTIEGQTVGKVRAMVEEGRLILLQLMGRLVTIYRTMTWGNIGQGSVPRARRTMTEIMNFKKQDK